MQSRPGRYRNNRLLLRLLSFGLLLTLPLLTTACTTTGATEGQDILDFYCGANGQAGAYVPVQLSHSDTAETIKQTEANNAVYDGMCTGGSKAE